jgi:hypothetical protein
MKITKQILFVFTLIITFTSCESLLGSDDDDFSCEKNAPVILNNEEICAGAGSKIEAGKFKISFGYATGGFEITIDVDDFKQDVNYTYANGEVSVWFNNLNKVNSGILLITKLDEVNRVMSGQFNFDAESNNNSQAFPYILGGKFNDVSY